jgi:hypothetical protein
VTDDHETRDARLAAEFVEDQLSTGPGLKATFEKYMNLVNGYGAEFVSTEPRNPIFEAIDRASMDRTPVVETTVTPNLMGLHEAMAKVSDAMEGVRRAAHRVALMGTGYRRHAHPGKLCPCGGHRAEHARQRRLYSERLRRDRRRRRKGRAPILRSSAFQALIPRAQVNPREAGPEYGGMEVILSPLVPDDQVFVFDPSVPGLGRRRRGGCRHLVKRGRRRP